MGSVEANVGVGVENVGARNPSIEVWAHGSPSRSSPLTAAAQSLPPQSAETFPKPVQHPAVPRHRVISVVAFHDPFQPRADGAHRLMHLPTKLLSKALELRAHPLGRRAPPDHKVAWHGRLAYGRDGRDPDRSGQVGHGTFLGAVREPPLHHPAGTG
jgi:hypothetical protein